jgi:glutamate-1-semialdehyde 2,1-aminomutase
LIDAVNEVIDGAGLPAHTVAFGAKGCVTWAEVPIRNYRDYKATDFDLAFAQWIHGINRGVLLPLVPSIYDPILNELEKHGVVFAEEEVE